MVKYSFHIKNLSCELHLFKASSNFKMDLQTASRFLTLLVALINVFSSQGTHLPNKDRLAVGNCLKSIIEPLFAENIGREQTPAQFLGNFCTLNVHEVQQRFEQQYPGVDLVNLIKSCLKNLKTEYEVLFNFYKTIGSSLLGPQQPASTSREDAMISTLVSELTVQPKNLDFFTFAYGLCNTNEFVDYDQLTDQIEKAVTRTCCQHCATSFFNTIYKIFMKEINDARAFFLDPNYPERASRVEELPDTSQISGYENFNDECLANRINNFKNLNKLGIFRLQEYNRIFKELEKIFASVYYNMDEQLANTYFDYNSCIGWGCGLNTKNTSNVPFANWLNKNVEKETIDNQTQQFLHSFSRVMLRKCQVNENYSEDSDPNSAKNVMIREIHSSNPYYTEVYAPPNP